MPIILETKLVVKDWRGVLRRFIRLKKLGSWKVEKLQERLIMSDTIKKLTQLGQSLWMDNIQRKLLENGKLKAMIERGDIRGMTSNPTIFNNAIAKSTDYDSALTPLAWAGWDAEKIFWQLAIEDIKAACDAFLPLYEESNGGDGYVSIEVRSEERRVGKE